MLSIRLMGQSLRLHALVRLKLDKDVTPVFARSRSFPKVNARVQTLTRGGSERRVKAVRQDKMRTLHLFLCSFANRAQIR